MGDKKKQKNKKEIISSERKGYGPSVLSGSIRNIAKKIIGKRGFVEVDIISKWETIVGKTLAKNVIPQKIIFRKGRRDGGTLHLLVSNGAFAIELQHKEPMVISRINSFFGYRAVEKLKISQGYWANGSSSDESTKIAQVVEKNEEVEKVVGEIENQDLKTTLDLLGNLVYMKNKQVDDE
jgi:hypothetical protein